MDVEVILDVGEVFDLSVRVVCGGGAIAQGEAELEFVGGGGEVH